MKKTSVLRGASLLLLSLLLCLSLVGCGNLRLPSVAENGLYMLKTADKEGWVVDSDSDMTPDVVIPETFKDKPVTKIAADAFNVNSRFDSISIPDSIEKIGPGALEFNPDKLELYNELNGGYYLGNEDNPYLVLVYTDEDSVTLPAGTKFIISGAIGPDVNSLHISATVKQILPDAFSKVRAGISLENGELQIFGLYNVTVGDGSQSYAVENGMLMDKEMTRLLYVCPGDGRVIPDSVEFVEPYALGSNPLSFCKEAYETSAGYFIPSESNPLFYMVCATTSAIPEGTAVLGPESCTEMTDPVLPDSLVQIHAGAFMNDLASVTATTDGWYPASVYMDGDGSDFGLFTYLDKETMVYVSDKNLKKYSQDFSDEENALAILTYCGNDEWRRNVIEAK